jgi:CDP-diglyceride synthetase
MTLQIIDHLCVVIAFIIPAYVVLRSPHWMSTIPLGAVIFWLTLIITGYLLSAFDPERSTAVLDTIWRFFGWLAGLLYASSLYALRRLFVVLRHHFTSPPPKGPKPQRLTMRCS